MNSKTTLAAGLAVALMSVGMAHAATINLATGFSGGSLATSGDMPDDHWTVANADNFKQGPTAFSVFSGNADYYSGWLANGPNSAWIAADPDVGDNGNQTFSFSFNLSAAEAASASLSAAWAIDDSGSLNLNGHEISYISGGNWNSLQSVSDYGFFVAGPNTLKIQTTNSDGYLEAARLEGAVTYTASPNAVPEPASWALMLLGFGGLGGVLRARRQLATASV